MLGRILALEDEAVVALDIEACLLDAGYDVIAVVPSADEALRIAREERPDILLADISVEGSMDGIEAARAIRRICDADIVFLTAHGDPVTKSRAAAVEPLGYLIKPFLDVELAAAVGIALCRHRARCCMAEPRLPFEVNPSLQLQVLRSGDDECPLHLCCVGMAADPR